MRASAEALFGIFFAACASIRRIARLLDEADDFAASPYFTINLENQMKTIRNHVDDAIVSLNRGLAPWVIDVCKKRCPHTWHSEIEAGAGAGANRTVGKRKLAFSDPQETLKFVLHRWNDVFKTDSPPALRTLIFEMNDARNAVYHHDSISNCDALRIADLVVRILELIDSGELPAAEQNRKTLALQYAREIGESEQAAAVKENSNDSLEGSRTISDAVTRFAATIEDAIRQSQKQSLERADNLSRQVESESRATLDEIRDRLSAQSETLQATCRTQLTNKQEVAVLTARMQKHDGTLREFQTRIRDEVSRIAKTSQASSLELVAKLEQRCQPVEERLREIFAKSNAIALQLKKELQLEEHNRRSLQTTLLQEIHEEKTIRENSHEEIHRVIQEQRLFNLRQSEQTAFHQTQVEKKFAESSREIHLLLTKNSDLVAQLEQVQISLRELKIEFHSRTWSTTIRRWCSKARNWLEGTRLRRLLIPDTN